MYKKKWYKHTTEYYLALKRNEILTRVTTWMNLNDIMLSEISQSQKDKAMRYLGWSAHEDRQQVGAAAVGVESLYSMGRALQDEKSPGVWLDNNVKVVNTTNYTLKNGKFYITCLLPLLKIFTSIKSKNPNNILWVFYI